MVSGVFFLRIGTCFFAFSGLRFAWGLALAGGLSLVVLGMIGNFFYEHSTICAKYHRLYLDFAIAYAGNKFHVRLCEINISCRVQRCKHCITNVSFKLAQIYFCAKYQRLDLDFAMAHALNKIHIRLCAMNISSRVKRIKHLRKISAIEFGFCNLPCR